MKAKVTIKGGDKAKGAFRGTKENAGPWLLANLKKIGLRVETSAKRNARAKHVRKTGRLIGSISTNWTGSGLMTGKVDTPAKATDGVGQPPPSGSGKRFVVVVGSGVEYAIYQEFGTKRMTGRPFLFPAFQEHIHEIPEVLRGDAPTLTSKARKGGGK